MQSRKQTKERLLPTGECWCGCSTPTPVGSFYTPGHDKVAESAVIVTHYGGVPEFLVAHGFGPTGKNAGKELEQWRKSGGKVR